MPQPEEREAVLRYFLSHPPGAILDIPCGRRLWLSRPLAARGFDCHAADLYCECEPVAGVHFQRADMNRVLPYADRSFDYIACVEGIEHVENTHHLLREFARVLKPGGKIMLSTPNVLNVKSRLRYLVRGTFLGFPHILHEVQPGEHVHINPVTISSLQFAARLSGLRIERVLPFPVRGKDWVYLPVALLAQAMTTLELLLFNHRSAEHRRLYALMVSRPLLLGNALIVGLEKPHGA
jgi:SAM-dependent methyltransferase